MSFQRKNKLVSISSLVLIITGIIYIAIQLSNVNYLLVFFLKYIELTFNSCLCLILIGAGYMLLQFDNNKKARFFLVALALLLTVICTLTILEFTFHFNAGIDGLFIPGGYSNPIVYRFTHGRMLPGTVIIYLCLGLALIGYSTKIRFVHVLSQYFLHVASVFCSILLIGFAYSNTSLVNMQTHALNYLWVAGWLVTLSIAASFRHPSLGLTSLFSGNLVGNKMARRLFAMMAVSILVFGLVKAKYLGFTIWQYDTAISLFVFCILVAALLIIWHTANWLNMVDLRRIKAENELKILNQELGKRVEERTAELSDLLEKYKDSELKFRTVAEKSMLGVYVTQNKRFLYVNPRFAEIFGYTCQELLNLSTGVIDTIYAEESRAMIREKIRARDNGETEGAHYEAIGLKKDGAKTHVEFYGNRVTINGQPAVIGTVLDITERKRMEAELREAETKFRTLVEKSMVGVYVGQGERFIYVNPRLAKIFGYEPQEIIDMPGNLVDKLFSNDSGEIIRANLKARYSGETESAQYEVTGIRKNGARISVEFYGNMVMIGGQPAIIGTMLDITERKQAEELVLKEKELSNTIINRLPGLFYLRNEQGKLVRWNKNVELTTGYTAEEIEGLTINGMVASADHHLLQAAAEKVLKEGHASIEVRFVKKDGARIPYLLTGSPIMYENQLCLLGIGIDISQRVKIEEELRISEQSLAAYNRELNLLNTINDIILRNGDELELYREVCNCIVRTGGYKLAWICHKPDENDASQIVKPLVAVGVMDYLSDVSIDLSDPELSEGPTGTVLLTGKTFVNNDMNNLVFFAPWVERAKKHGILSSLALYLELGNGKTGALMIYSGQTDAFDKHEVYMLERLASNVSIAVQNIENRGVLIESENRFRSAFEDSAIGMGLTSIEKESMGRWLKVNRSLCDMLGYTEDELLSLTFMQITHPDDLAMDIAAQERILQGGSNTYRLEKRYIHKNGSFIWINLNVSIVRDKDKQPIYLVAQIENITEKVESQRKFQNLVENVIVGVYILQNRKLVYVNPRIVEETGYSEEEIVGMPYDQFIYGDDREFVMQIISAREKGLINNVRYEARIIKKDGGLLWYEIIGSTTTYKGANALIGTMINVSERKAVYDELKKSEANLRSIFDSTDVSYLLLDTEYNVIALNQQMIDIYRDNVAITLGGGDNLIELIVPERRQSARKIYDDVVRTKKPSAYEASFTNNGFTRHFAASVFPIIVGNETIGLCISTIDITEAKNALEKLEAANEGLLQKTKELEYSNTELEQFAYVASHDLQEPLRMVTSFLSQLEKKYGDALDEKGKKYIYFATDGAKRMRQLILDLLEFSRVGRTEDGLEEVDFNDLMNEVLPLFRRNIEELKAKVYFDQLPAMQVYKTPVRQVFHNLLSNALKYHREGVAPSITISSKETPTAFEFSFKDNGIGIDAEYFNQIFIIFKRLHNRDQYPGTGMGLAVTKKIVENMGGRIWVDSREGEGSVFHFTIPKLTNR